MTDTEVTGLPVEVRELLDKQAIHEVLMRYCRGTDRADHEAMAGAFHPTATLHHGVFRGIAHDFVNAYIPRVQTKDQVIQHALANVLIDIAGDEAESESSFLCYIWRYDDEGERVVDVFAGRYLDSWTRFDEGWKIVDRVLSFDWGTVLSTRHEFPFPIPEYAVGTWAPHDAVYSRPKPGQR